MVTYRSQAMLNARNRINATDPRHYLDDNNDVAIVVVMRYDVSPGDHGLIGLKSMGEKGLAEEKHSEAFFPGTKRSRVHYFIEYI
jgi:hypothetical protein